MNENPYTSGTAATIEAEVIPPSNRPHTFVVGMLLLVSSLAWVFGLTFGFTFFLMSDYNEQNSVRFPLAYYIGIGICMLYNIILAIGAVGILRRCSYGFAIAVFCMALVPFLGPFYVIGPVIGICGLLALRKPEARASFERSAK